MNEQNEIGGDLQDEYNAIQHAIAKGTELLSEEPTYDLTDDDLEGWYQEWLADQPNPEEIDPEYYSPRIEDRDPRD